MSELRYAVLGAGFWSKYQMAGWGEIPGVRCLAVCDRTRSKAEQLASEFGVPNIEDDAKELLSRHDLDFVDIITDVDSHVPLATMALERGVAVICQKPLAPSMEEASQLCRTASSLGVPLLVHENWRWQTPLRRLKTVIDSGSLGSLVRARIDYAHSFPVFDNQPFLKTLERFILTDIGTHILDLSRFLFGEAEELYCQTRQMRNDIAGEDVATVMIRKQSGLTVTCNMSYASHWEFDRFPQTMVAIEGTLGGVSLGTDYELNTYTVEGKQCEKVAIPQYAWADPAYDLIHASIVECQKNLVSALRGSCKAETTGADNLRSLELVYAAYESASSGSPVSIPKTS